MTDEYYKEVLTEIHAEASKRRDKESIVWDVIEGTAAVFDGATGSDFGSNIKVGKKILDKARGKKEPGIVPNPWFIVNDHTRGNTTYSEKHLKGKTKSNTKSLGKAVAAGSTVASLITQVDAVGVIKHGNAVSCSLTHIHHLQSMAGSYKQSKTLAGWFNLLIKMKALKAGSRGAELVGAAIPIGSVGIATAVSAAAINMGIKLSMKKVCLAASADIHWRAYQEQTLHASLNEKLEALHARGEASIKKGKARNASPIKSTKAGPASKMMYEIFRQRGLTRFLSQKDVNKLITDPGGWLVLNEKLMSI